MFQLCYLVLEIPDVLAGVCVVQLALDLSFFFLLGDEDIQYKQIQLKQAEGISNSPS